jgi:hypothetical protein
VGHQTKLLNLKQPNEHEVFIVKELRKNKFMAGQDLRKVLVEHFNLLDDTGRKILQRAALNGFITTSAPLTFGNGQYVYLITGEEFTASIITKICKQYRPPIYRLLRNIDLNNGITSYYEALKITSSSDDITSTKISTLPEILSLLVQLNLCYELTDENEVKYIISKREGKELSEMEAGVLMQIHFSKMVMDCVFMPDILRWLKQSNIIDNYLIKYRNKKRPSLGAMHNGHMWDAFAYTKTTGINPIVGKKADSVEKQTLVVIDIVMNREYDITDVEGLYNRVQIYLRSVRTGVRKVMPIVIYRSISDHAFNTLRTFGFMSFDIGSIFGSRIYEIMDKLNMIEDFEDLEKTKIQDAIEATLTTIRESGQEDSLKALRGTLFEYILYPLLTALYPNAQVYQGKQLSTKKDNDIEGYEYDYIIKSSHPQEIVIVELKGYSSNRFVSLGSTEKKDKGSLKWFFERTLPFAKNKYSQESSLGTPVKGVFITSANFYDEGLEYLERANLGTYKSKKINVFYDGKSLIKLLEDNDELKAKQTITKFYINTEQIDSQLRKS